MITTVRALNSAGIDRFSSWLNNPVGEPPFSLLSDPGFSEEIDEEFHVDLSTSFDTTFALGSYLSAKAFSNVSDRLALNENHAMWAWISLAFIRSLVPRAGKGAGRPLARAHYIDSGPRHAYRLIARTAWNLVRLHGDSARLALSSARTPWGEMAEQMTSTQEIFVHPRVWPVAYRLYMDANANLKPGVTSKRDKKARRDPKNRMGLGGVRRLPRTFRQFDRTYNTREMPAQEIIELLPTEYARWS